MDDRLQEMHFGNWEMQPWSIIPREQIDAWVNNPLAYVVPGGESVALLQQRLVSFLVEKQGVHDALILVTHAGIMKVMHAIQGNVPPSQWLSMAFGYGELVSLELPPLPVSVIPGRV